MEPSKSIQISTKLQGTCLPLLLCPFCKKNIPQILFKPSNAEISLVLTCSCSKEEKTISLRQFISKLSESQQKERQCLNHLRKAEKYCPKCREWLCQECLNWHSKFAKEHLLFENEVNFECKTHNKPFSAYCLECGLNLCADCEPFHFNHNLQIVKSIDLDPIRMGELDTAMINTLIRKDKLVERISKLISKMTRMKQEIQSAYETNYCINKDLLLMFQYIYHTAAVFRAFPSFELMKLQQDIVINKKLLGEEKKSIEDEFNQLKDYLENDYVLKQINQCIATLAGHLGSVLYLCKLEDKQLASGSNDKTIKKWANANKFTTVKVDTVNAIHCLVLLKDGRVASGCERTIVIGKATLTGHNDAINCLFELENGNLASASNDHTIKLWNTQTNRCFETLIGHSEKVYCLYQLKNGDLASGSADKTIKMWNTEYTFLGDNYRQSKPNKLKATLTGHSSSVLCLTQLKDERLVSGSHDTTIKLWDIATQKCLASLMEHSGSIYSLAELTNGRLASGSQDTTIKVWNLTTNQCRATLVGHISTIKILADLKNNMLASGSDDTTIKIWVFV